LVRETIKRICREYAGKDLCYAACIVDVGGTFRGYGRQLREYLVNMREICQRHGDYFLDVGKKKSLVRETIKRISREYAGKCLGTGDN
jgi:hypothetical protein